MDEPSLRRVVTRSLYTPFIRELTRRDARIGIRIDDRIIPAEELVLREFGIAMGIGRAAN
jgi:hypothetical protein